MSGIINFLFFHIQLLTLLVSVVYFVYVTIGLI